MKKLTLFLVATLFSALSFAALNPYAYGLSSTLDGTTLTVNYSLNAPATAVSVVIMDGETEVHTVACDGKTKGSHSVDISTIGLPTGKSLTWKVNVTGAAVAKATAVKTYRFFHPSGIDVDNNPESSNFGRILCLEANHSVKTTTSTNGYLGKGYGAGIYAFDAAFDKITNGSYPGFNGGNTFTTTHYAVRRIRISDDGRIFVTAQNNGGCFLWEVDPDNLNSWTKVFEGKASTYTTTTSDGKFIAGTNSGFDVHGSSENLKLVMLSANISGGNQATFRCDEYDLGTAKTWSTVPSRTIPGASYHIVTNQSNVQYDKDGGVWHIQYRGTCSDANPGLVHINKDGEEDYRLLRHNTRNAGFCFNKDFTKVIIAGKFQNGTGTQKYATIYAVSKDADGKPVLTEEQVVDMTNIGYALNDFAWDWADNIYAVDNNGEYLCAYALPHTADKVVSTPCASKYAFEVEEIVANVYTLTTNVVGEGTIEGNDGSYVEGTTATLTATPAAHYDFVNWTYGSETSTANPLTITVNSDLTVTANFQEHAKYTITASAADNTMGYVTGGGTYYAGETVTLKAVANSTYYFVNWSDGNTDAIRTFTATADVTLTANFAKATPRAWAYDLKVVEDGDNYKFTFNATTAGTATLLFADKEGNALAPTSYDLGAINAGLNTASVAKSLFTEPKDIYWSVKMDGEAITSVAEITDQSRNIYDFYNMQGVVVDNDPNSEKFGEIYIEMAKSGTTNGKAQKLGLFLLNQNLDVLNTDPNVGIQPTMPSGYALNGTNYTFQRLNIHPKTGDLVFSYGISSKPAVFAIDRENMTGSVTNLLDGITGLTKTVAHCFDAEGTLYVMDLPSSGTIYKIKDGAKSTFAVADSKYAASNITMASDGRGGLWVAQNRGQIDSYYQLVHYNNGGTVDYSVYDDHKTYNSTNGTLGVSSTGLTGYSTRGALAYDVERQILAQGRNNAVEVFSVAYDATTGAPSLTKIATTPIATAANIDGIAFDYAGDLYVVNSGNEKFNKYTLPTAENICTVPAPESQAIIKEVRYTVTVNTVGNGTATGAGEYVVGEIATLEASPAANHQFVNWTYGSETSTDNPLELVVDGDITVTANFAPVQYTLIAPTNDENKGTVTGAGTYNYGTEVTLTATPATGYKLLYWSDRSTDNPRTITMTKNEAISAYFVKEYATEPMFTIEKMWENTNVPASTGNGYQAVGWDGKIYMQDAGHSKIITFSDEADTGTEYATSGAGQQIAVDEAGNLIVFNATFYVENPNSILIYKKGETTNKPISFTLPQPQRCDFFSASGDIYSAEGGYVYFYCKTKQVVNRVKIANGELVSVDVVGNNITAGNTQNHVMLDIFGNLVAHSRSAAINATINVHTSESMAFTLQNHKNSTLGGCSFELGGKELWAYNVGSTAYNSEWNIYNLTDKKNVSQTALYAKNTTDKNSAANWLNVQVVNENTAYIYQFCPKVAAAVWKVTIDAEYTYELNGGVTNDYGWMSKDDMFKACMNDGDVTTLPSLTELKAKGNDAALTAICGKFGKVAAQKVLDNDKWNWLEEYVMSVQNASSATKLVAGGDPTDNTGWAYAIAAFFIEGQRTTWPVSANFAQAGLDEAYQRAWEHGYDNPTKPTSEFVLNTPYKEDYTFDGWYTTSDFSGEKVTTIQKPTTDITLYAKWIEYIPTIAEVKALADNATTNVTGVVTYISGNEVFVQDPTGGIVIVTATNATCTIGQSIKASGTKTITNGAPQVINATIASAEAGTLPEETAFESLNQLVNDTDLKHYATRITVPGLKVASYDSNGYPILTDGLNTALCYKMPINQSTFPEGTKVVITAVGGWNNGFQFRGDVAGITLAPGIAKDTYAYPERENGKYTLANEWIVSNIEGNYQANKPGPDGYVRAMAATNGKMYFINRETESLTVVDGATGEMLNSIAITGTDIFKVSGVNAVTVAYNDVKVDNAGNILISACVSSTNTFFVYIVDPATGVATELVKDHLQTTWPSLNYRFDAIGVAGDVTKNGVIMAANANAWEAYRWKINDGVVGTCEKITLTGTGSNPGTAPQIQPLDAQGKQFYVDGSGINPILFNEDGTQAGKFTAGATIRNNIDDVAYLNQTLNGITEFTIGADRFAVLAATATNTTPPASYALYKFTDDSHNISTAEPLWFFPNNGMGTVTNGSFAAPVSVEVNEQIATIYLYSANNGYAAYTFTVNQVTISDDADNTTALVDYEGKTVTAVVTRNFTANNYMTLTLPFDMSATQITQVFGNGAKVYELAKVVEGATEIHLQFRPTSDIVAGTPYILDIDADVNGFTIDNVVIDTELRPVDLGAITMVPVLDYDGTKLNQATQYWLASDNYLYSAGTYPTDLLGLRAYFQSSSPLPVRARVVYNENETTDLPTIEQPANNVRKIFKDGQIIIIRGEQQYNIQGQRMQ